MTFPPTILRKAADHPSRPTESPEPSRKPCEDHWRFKVGRFLPRWASRIALEIVSVGAERLQEISEEDAVAEGVDNGGNGYRDYRNPLHEGIHLGFRLATDSYHTLWELINGRGSWDANPWVWKITFRPIEKEARV